MGISLIVATVGRVDEVQRFLAGMVEQTRKDFEVIIVDQNPDDRLVAVASWASNHAIPIRHLRLAQPNLCMARNYGLAEACNDLIGFPDDDCWYSRTLVETVLSRFAEADKPDGVVVRWLEQDPEGACPPHFLTSKDLRRFREISTSSITQFFRKSTLEELEGFDLALGLHSWFGSGEETDLMFRALREGAKVAYCPNILVHHHVCRRQRNGIGSSFSRSRRRARGTGALYAKHQIDISVMARGLLSPWLRACAHLNNPQDAATHLGAALGRLEGYLRWKWERP